jgi:hypothetical protein
MMRSAMGLQATHDLLRSGQNFLALSRQVLRSSFRSDTPTVWQSLFVDPLIQLEQQISGNADTLTNHSKKPVDRSRISENNPQSYWNFDRVPSSFNRDLENEARTLDSHLGKSMKSSGSSSSGEADLLMRQASREMQQSVRLLDSDRSPFQYLTNHSTRVEVPGDLVHPRPMVPDDREAKRDRLESDRLMAQSEGYHHADASILPVADRDRVMTVKSIIPSDADLSHRDRSLSSITNSVSIPSSDLQLIETPSRLAKLLQANLQTNLPTHFSRAEFSAGQPNQSHSPSIEEDSLAPAKFMDRFEPVQAAQPWNATIRDADVLSNEEFTTSIPHPDLKVPSALTSDFLALSHPEPHQLAIAPTELAHLSPSVVHPQAGYPAWDLDDLLDQVGDRLEMEYLRTYGTSGR